MRVLVVGATGALGRQVVPRLLERGHAVNAVTTRPEAVAHLRVIGADAFVGDILDAATLRDPARGCDAALHLATRIPKAGGARDFALNDRIRREGTANLIAAAQEAGFRRYVQQSITFLYGDHGSDWIDEDTPLAPASFASSTVDMEDQVRASGLDWCILRGAAFYGPGTGREESWAESARAGTLTVPGDGSAYTSLIHSVDIARAFVLATESAPSGTTFNVVDDEPVQYATLYPHLAVIYGGPAPKHGGSAGMASQRCTNRRLKDALGWEPVFPSFRSGLA